MESKIVNAPLDVLYRLHAAQNKQDLEAFVACFAMSYQSEQPVHPGIEFAGRDQVRQNWSRVFGSVPDFRSELLRSASDDDKVWAEWRWCGTRSDGVLFDLRGVTIFQVEDNQIIWAHLYMEPVQTASAGIDAHIQKQLNDRGNT